MAEQLTFDGVWERVRAEAGAPEPLVVVEPPLPASPRQTGLFDGPLSVRTAMERACAKLDAAGVRAAWRAATAEQPAWAKVSAAAWPAWAEAIEALVGRGAGGGRGEAGTLTAEEQARRAMALLDDQVAAARLHGMALGLRREVRAAALARAALRLVDERGPGARLDDGRPAATLLVRAGRPEEALPHLERAAQASPDDPVALAALAEAAWAAGHAEAAIVTWRDACLIGPEAIDETSLAAPVLAALIEQAADLELDEPLAAWIPVLADLQGVLPLGGVPIAAAKDAPPARRAAAHLSAWRRLRATGAIDDTARIAARRDLVRIAPRLRPLAPRLT